MKSLKQSERLLLKEKLIVYTSPLSPYEHEKLLKNLISQSNLSDFKITFMALPRTDWASQIFNGLTNKIDRVEQLYVSIQFSSCKYTMFQKILFIRLNSLPSSRIEGSIWSWMNSELLSIKCSSCEFTMFKILFITFAIGSPAFQNRT